MAYCQSFFSVSVGLIQGCHITLQLFNLYISDLIEEIQNHGLRIPTDEDLIGMLLYADDIALLAKCETDLQKMLDRLHEWYSHWKLKVNVLKTQVMLFRRVPSVARSLFKYFIYMCE